MQDSNILLKVCENNGISYIIFSKDFKIVEFSKNAAMLTDNQENINKGDQLQDIFWEFIGLEENILELLKKSNNSYTIPMLHKNSIYYDIDIELCSNDTYFIAQMVQKSESSLKYLNSLQEINKKTLSLQNNDTKNIKKNYYDILNKQLITFQVNTQGLITEVNQICTHFLGKEESELVGSHFSDFFSTRESALNDDGEKIFTAKNISGEEIFFHADVIPVKRNDVVYENIIICQDVTYLKRIEKELEYASSHDSLTGVANRTLLLKKIDEAIEQSDKDNTLFGLCFIDLDKFKTINDTYGHHAGDMLLKHIASMLENFVRDFDTIARIGGDEFIILFNKIENVQYLTTAIQRINKLAQRNPLPYTKDETISFGFSLGYSIYPNDAKDASSLLEFADKEMYKVKNVSTTLN